MSDNLKWTPPFRAGLNYMDWTTEEEAYAAYLASRKREEPKR